MLTQPVSVLQVGGSERPGGACASPYLSHLARIIGSPDLGLSSRVAEDFAEPGGVVGSGTGLGTAIASWIPELKYGADRGRRHMEI